MKQRVKRVLRRLALLGYAIMARILPLSKDVVVFESNVGRNYSGNAKAIYEEMVKQGLDRQYRIVWSVENVKEAIPGY